MSASDQNWTPEAGKKALWGSDDVSVTIKRVHKGGTVTLTYWGRALLEGKLVTQRGVVAKNLRPWRPVAER